MRLAALYENILHFWESYQIISAKSAFCKSVSLNINNILSFILVFINTVISGSTNVRLSAPQPVESRQRQGWTEVHCLNCLCCSVHLSKYCFSINFFLAPPGDPLDFWVFWKWVLMKRFCQLLGSSRVLTHFLMLECLLSVAVVLSILIYLLFLHKRDFTCFYSQMQNWSGHWNSQNRSIVNLCSVFIVHRQKSRANLSHSWGRVHSKCFLLEHSYIGWSFTPSYVTATTCIPSPYSN